MPSSTSSTCAACGSQASKQCSACTEGLDTHGKPSPIFYCSKDCQKADFATHKPLCRAANVRKQLYRGADVAQELFYEFRKATFDLKPTSLNVVDGKLHITLSEGLPPDKDGSLYPSPSHLVEGIKDKQTLLAWNTGETAPAYMYKFLRKAFEGLLKPDCPPTETKVMIKDCHKRVVRFFENGARDDKSYDHTVITLELTNGESYVVDLVGAQYGHYRAVMPKAEYMDVYVSHIAESKPFGYNAELWMADWLQKLLDSRLGYDADVAAVIVRYKVAGNADLDGALWMKRNMTDAKDFLNVPHAHFDKGKESLLGWVREDMRRYIVSKKLDKYFRWH